MNYIVKSLVGYKEYGSLSDAMAASEGKIIDVKLTLQEYEQLLSKIKKLDNDLIAEKSVIKNLQREQQTKEKRYLEQLNSKENVIQKFKQAIARQKARIEGKQFIRKTKAFEIKKIEYINIKSLPLIKLVIKTCFDIRTDYDDVLKVMSNEKMEYKGFLLKRIEKIYCYPEQEDNFWYCIAILGKSLKNGGK